MEKPNVLITCPVSQEYVAKLNADPRVGKVELLPRELWPLFREIFHGGAEAAAGGPRELGPYFAEADAIVCQGLPYGAVAWSPRLKWVQAWSAGIDHMRGTGVLEAGIPLTRMVGNSSIPIAEHVLMTMLMLARNAKAYVDNSRKRQWRPSPPRNPLYGRTVGVVGLGAIGSRVAKLCRGFDMRVLATRRTAVSREMDVQGVDELLPSSDLTYLLEQSDFVVLSCPLTPETEGLIGEKELRTMKSSAFLVNICRGEVIDEQVLIRALKEDWIAGAGLDVFTNEPLEPESELWDMPNVLMTPHRSGGNVSADESPNETALTENLERFLTGRPLANQVDPALGY